MMTQRDLARAVGVSHVTIGKIERRAIQKIRRAVADFAAAAGVSPRDWLLGEGEEELSESASQATRRNGPC